MAFGVADFLTEARVLLQDQVQPFRFADSELVTGLNLAIKESRKIRPDFWIGVSTLPSFSAPTDVTNNTAVSVDEQYTAAFVYYICGNAQLRDEEYTQDSRAVVFLQKFTAQLLGVQA
jgi:hypothetical protein